MRILFIKLSAIGDVVQTLPALEAIHQTFPGSEIDWVVEEAASGILDGHPLIDTLLVSRRKTWLRMLRHPRTFREGVRESLRFVHLLRSRRYDIAIDFQGLFKSGVLIGLARAERKIGFSGSREFSSFFLNERLPAYDPEQHALDRYLDIARYLGADNPSPRCELSIGREIRIMKDRLSGMGVGAKTIVVINPVARWETKLWQEQKFAELADRLIHERNAAVIFTGSPDDRPVVTRILKTMKGKGLNWAGETTLKELAALASLSSLFVTTDTGPMHLAAAAGARVAALFGPTAPWRTGPYGSTHVVIRSGAVCSPCFQRVCSGDQHCMRDITVDAVLDQLPA